MRPISKHDAEDLRLAKRICELHAEHRGIYGVPRMKELLRRDGISISNRRLERLMKEYGLRGVSKRLRPKVQRQMPERENSADLIKRNFTADKPNKCWFADITYVKTREGWLYLAVVFDIFSRMVVGWAMDESMSAVLVDEALRMGIERRRPEAGCIHHSDHGSQYRSLLLGKTMQEFGIVPSMGSIASPWDNAVTESLMSTIKAECTHHRVFESRHQAALEIFDYIECFYNRLRLHSALGNMSPLEFEERYYKLKAA